MGRLQRTAMGDKGAIGLEDIKFFVSLIGRSKGLEPVAFNQDTEQG